MPEGQTAPITALTFALTRGVLICVWVATSMNTAIAGEAETLLDEFRTGIQPLLARYCHECHSGDSPAAKLDTAIFEDLGAVTASWGSWQDIVSRVHAAEMPPVDASPQPTAAERELLTEWTKKFRRAEAERLRDDPGPVSTRRLSNAEFNYTIRDLTGVDIQPTKSFPVDPANAAGFDNSAESLSISPALVTKYLDAARQVADHLLLTPDGIRFAPHPVVTDTDRDKYCVQRIVDFYRRQPVRYEDYLHACWQVRSKSQAGAHDPAIADAAREFQISDKYLRTVWETLNSPEHNYGPLAALRARWGALPIDALKHNEVRTACAELAALIQEKRTALKPQFANLQGPAGLSGGSQTLVLWKNRQAAAHRRDCRVEALTDERDTSRLETADLEAYRAGSAADRHQIIEAYKHFCSLFPDTFFVAERGRAHIDAKDADQEGKGRLLSAGFHSMMGYFRDDRPLYELVLSEEQQRELDRLWRELDFITLAPIRQYSGFIWYERAESSFINEDIFNFVRAEDRSANSDAMIGRFADLYLEKVRRKQGSEEVLAAVEFYFADMNRQLRQLEEQLQSAQPVQLAALVEFAERAYRRPLTQAERLAIEDFYRTARQLPSADHRSAMEDTLISILVSPSQLYRWDLQSTSTEVHPLVDYEMASRLSYSLWASLPDAALLQRASLHQLSDEPVLLAELQRMLGDARARGMAQEFMGNWLDFRRFESHNGVDRNQFPSFDDRLRQSMAEEPIEYFLDLLRRDGSIMELLDSDHIIVDQVLAEHYGVEHSLEGQEPWQRVDRVGNLQRGGLIPMGVFLTQNSPGLRTSPVKRGYWVVRKLLGEKIPPPPPNVPELPASEHQLGDLTLRELLAKHREHPSCASCHDRFDAAGLLLEGFDPIGRPRTTDLGGREISSHATLPNGEDANGLQGLREYILQHRADDFRRHFCQSLVSYTLGRSLIIPDELLVDEMLDQLKNNDDRIQVAFESIIRSPQFRNKRGSAASQQEKSHDESR